ncbi:hypothetical protein PR202_ga02418 [Eleusine coracana subsp. coracana]|uniref:Uncharacterized protein n=1 Tax=Eleusine coracana subsp. coracana TaxID=191504 RepID=A0AAV5BJE4_ELECO|nr:hypothetical protein QOZ80_2AG0142270 [Eleusine coracana subsp. coracana]GJM86549.1 hypothetical protein PR202_ga02418 [Eleusine coracana subsp. coracana]
MQGQDPGHEQGRAPPKRKQKRPGEPSGREETSAIRELLQEFFDQQLRLDLRRQEMMERHAQEWLFFEGQWRQAMQRIEQERLMLEQQWAEREEQRRAREEARAERRDAILTSLLTRLLQGDL